MATQEVPLIERVSKSFSILCETSKELNEISDELGKSVTEIDSALKKLNLGVAVWVPIQSEDGTPDESRYWSEDLGYAKVGANWGICLRKVTGDYISPEGTETEIIWQYNEAPRTLRVSAIDKMPLLLTRLSSEAAKITSEIRSKVAEAKAIAEAITGAKSEFGRSNLDFLRNSVKEALLKAGHASAAQLVSDASWSADQNTIRIEVNGIGPKMLSLTVNPAAEKVIRQEFRGLGVSERFVMVPRDLPGKATDLNTKAGKE